MIAYVVFQAQLRYSVVWKVHLPPKLIYSLSRVLVLISWPLLLPVIDVADTPWIRGFIKDFTLTIWNLKVLRELLTLLLFWWNTFFFPFELLDSWSSHKMKNQVVNTKSSTMGISHIKYIINNRVQAAAAGCLEDELVKRVCVGGRGPKTLRLDSEGIKIICCQSHVLSELVLWGHGRACG